MTKKNKTIPVVEKTEIPETSCCCLKESTCDSCCSTTCECTESGCGCCKSSGTVAKCLTMLLSSCIISASIVLVGMKVVGPQVPQRIVSAKTVEQKVAGPQFDLQVMEALRKHAPVVAQIMDDHREKIAEEKRAEEKRVQEEAHKKRVEKVKTISATVAADASNYSLGNKDGKFVIIEFFDYNCGWCKKTNTEMWAALDAGKAPNIRWIPIDTPIFGENSAVISRYVLAAGKQGKYTEMHHAVANSKTRITEDTLISMAGELKLDVEKLKTDAASDEIKEKIASNMKLAEEIGVEGVPFMIIDGTPRPGALFAEALEDVIKASNPVEEKTEEAKPEAAK